MRYDRFPDEYFEAIKNIDTAKTDKLNKWYGKKALVIGDSTTDTGNGGWQNKLTERLGMKVEKHAKGGIGIIEMVTGSLGYNGDYDNITGETDILYPLSIKDVYDKDLIILFGGFNDRNYNVGNIGDLYKPDGSGQNTICGKLQYALDWIYEKLQGGTEDGEQYSENLSCTVIVVTPYCCGKYKWSNLDGYTEDSKGRSIRNLAKAMEQVAKAYPVPCYNAWENSGINRKTWNKYTASKTELDSDYDPNNSYSQPYPQYADQLHLNTEYGYPMLGDKIAEFVLIN